MRSVMVWTALILSMVANGATAQARVEKNVLYGMYSGLALLMDVYYPERSNGYGVLFVAGSGWRSALSYNATPLKELQVSEWGTPLVRAGYTVFAINHRAAPRFHYPAPFEDVQRAVRYVRHHAKRFGIDPARLGGVGGSSGAHLVQLTGMVAAGGLSDGLDPVDREPATLQALVVRASSSDMRAMTAGGGLPLVVSFMELPPIAHPENEELYRRASPIAYVSKGSPPTLLIHGDSDDTVPYQQSVAMEAALREAGVATKLVRIPGGEHGSDFGAANKTHSEWPNYFGEMVQWLDEHLGVPGRTHRK